MKVSEIEAQLSGLKAQKASKVKEVRALAMSDDSDTADVQKGVASVDDLQKQIDDLQAQLGAVKKAQGLSDDSTDDNTRDDDPDLQEERSLKGRENMEIKLNQEQETTEVRDFMHYLKTGEKRANAITTTEAGVVIPKEILDIQKVPTDVRNLSAVINRVSVTSGMGSLPILQKNTARLTTAEERAVNPEIAKAVLKSVDYKALTYRGALPLSMEMVQDAPNLKTLLNTYVQEAKELTEQYQIGKILQTATAVSAKTTDDLKTAYNKGLANYQRQWIVTESFYNAVDLLKDTNGRYLLQDSIASASGKSLFGSNVLIVADDVLGIASDAKAFVGDPKAFVLEAMRSDVAIEWDHNENFERILAVALRADFKAADTNAGKFITFSAGK
ncbi:Phage capsid protein [Leuconostoc pseudomesenteroides PS12]|nr:phage major capsid protein [Leuconostoc mesenteroides]KDA49035.1 Phage capsid protein [Leuconostoc pseudomesenteroides PS12]OQJ74055.1 capsid protein [Leuconostoc pseudomesenteroides]MDG9749942.1 phage major capsid protein [Leuconostoc mesenteroides]ORI50242.1 capsid protein [Leuconostoc pseudomesenteroides]ORI59964.1 capsid protein [Leuconostoc pseudomesenteroides]